MPAGRPSKYKIEYCEMLIDHMEKGGSYEGFAAIPRVCVDTLYEWETKHPEFSDAKKIAFSLSRVWWDRAGMAGMTGNMTRVKEKVYDKEGNLVKEIMEPATFNAAVWIFTMKNRFGWRDNKKIDFTNSDGSFKAVVELPPNAIEQLDPPDSSDEKPDGDN